MHQKWHN